MGADIKSSEKKRESLALRFLYRTVPGRAVLKLLSLRGVSSAAGRFFDSRASVFLIRGFIRRNNISAEEYCLDGFRCFNDCFVRKLRPGARHVDMTPGVLVSPCDGRLSAYRIRDGLVLPVKQSEYTVSSLIGGDPVSERFDNGICLVFRLCVDNYHRYCYVDNGTKGENFFIPGRLHTVRPIALERHKVFCENCREYTVMETESLGTVVQVEVGALLVGRIKNNMGAGKTVRGGEKGMFLYGGSTVILLLEPGKVNIPERYFIATEEGIEIQVKMGEKISE